MFRKILRAYLSLTRGERNGYLLLAILMMVLMAGRILIPVITIKPAPDFTEAGKAFMDFRSALQEHRSSPGREADSIHYQVPVPQQYFDFDPNYIAYEELLNLGLSERVARTLIKYRTSGGKFHNKKDLLKIYGLENKDFKRLEPFIDIPPVSATDIKRHDVRAFELNGSDTLQLEGIYGIGPVLSRRIIRYRDLLGGFYSREQLKEVYGLQEQQYEQLVRHVFIDTGLLERMNLNTVEREVLSGHPYLSTYQADAIIAYRDFSGEWQDIDEIRHNELLPDSVFERIRPYLKIE